MQGPQGPDRRPMSRGNRLLILASVLIVFALGFLSIYTNLDNNPPAPLTTQAPEAPSLPTPEGQGLLTIDDAINSITPTPTMAPIILATAPPTAEPNFYQTPAPTDIPTLKKNATGDDVRKLQERLIQLQYLRQGSNDGQYGKGTENAVRAFQNANGLNADGAAGPKTLTVLFSNDAKPKP